MRIFHIACLDEHDLQRVLAEIKSVSEVRSLGLNLGLLISAIDEIQKEFVTVKMQKIQIIKCWLRRTDIIREKQAFPPTWSQLADAVADEDLALIAITFDASIVASINWPIWTLCVLTDSIFEQSLFCYRADFF